MGCAEFQEKYTRLINSNGKLGRDSCSSVKSLGASERETLHISEEWSKYLIEVTGKDRASPL
jgi:hypothetical protein